jgi:hypothetical protein
MIKIFNNFLNKEDFIKIKELMVSQKFAWYLSPVVYTSDKNFQFTHVFYTNNNVNSKHLEILSPIINIIKPTSIIRIKANLLTKTEKIIEHKMHVDIKSDIDKKITTGILYINTNNGYTKFNKGKIINSVENKFVTFNSNELHTGTTCTDENYRIVINFNYIA